MQPLFQQDPGHVGGDAEAQVHRGAVRELQRRAPRDHLLRAPRLVLEGGQRLLDLAADGGVVAGLRGLHLRGVDDDVVDEVAGHVHVVRAQAAFLDHALDLRNDDAAVVARSKGLVEAAEQGPFVLVGEVAAFVGGGRADDGDVGHDGREVQPVLPVEALLAHHRVPGGGGVHGTALLVGVDEGAHAHLRQHAGAARGRVAVHVEQDAARDVVGLDLVVDDHLPDGRHGQRRRAARVRAGEHARQQARLRDVIDALDAVHVAGGDRMQHGQPPRLAFVIEALAERPQHLVGTAEPARRADGHDVVRADERGRLRRRDDLPHAAPRRSTCGTRTREPVRHASATAMAAARERTPSSPVAAGLPAPRSAAQKAATPRT